MILMWEIEMCILKLNVQGDWGAKKENQPGEGGVYKRYRSE